MTTPLVGSTHETAHCSAGCGAAFTVPAGSPPIRCYGCANNTTPEQFAADSYRFTVPESVWADLPLSAESEAAGVPNRLSAPDDAVLAPTATSG